MNVTIARWGTCAQWCAVLLNFALVSHLSAQVDATPFDESVAIPVESSGTNAPNIYRRAVGKMGGCTATVVSPPRSATTAVLLAAHCGGSSTFHVSGQSISGFTCYTNRFFPERGGSANDDVAICFSKQPFNGSLFGCLDSNLVSVGEEVRSLGYGNPQFNHDPVNTLLTGRMVINRVQDGKALLSQGREHVTPGDSGGPVVRMSAERADPNWGGGSFKIVGVNSKFFGGGGSVFAPFTQENLEFFPRAMQRWTTEHGGAQPTICGVNSQGDEGGGTLDPRRPRVSPVPDHSDPRRPRDIDPRAPIETLADILRSSFPRSLAAIDNFAQHLEPQKAARLLEVLKMGMGNPTFERFIARLGNPRPMGTVIQRLITALENRGGDMPTPTPDSNPDQPGPTDDAAWTGLFSNHSVSLLRSDQALDLIKKFRVLARNRGSNPDAFNAKAARWAASLTAAQRRVAADLLANLNFPHASAEDNAIKRALLDAIRGRNGGGDATGQANRAREFARNWNKSLNEAIEGDTVDLDKEITAHELGGRRMKVRDWAESIIKEHGYDDLVRWANSVGGNTGRKTLALLAKLDAGSGEPNLAVRPANGRKLEVDDGAGHKSTVTQPSVLEVGSNAARALDRMLPPNGGAWESSEFVRPNTLPSTAPHIKYNGTREPASDEPPAPPRHDDPPSHGGGTPPPRPFDHASEALKRCATCHENNGGDPADVAGIRAALIGKAPAARASLVDRMVKKGQKENPPVNFSAEEIAALKNISALPAPRPSPTPDARPRPAPGERASDMLGDQHFKDATAKCVSCHQDKPTVPRIAKDASTIPSAIAFMNDDRLREMLRRSRLSADQQHAIEEFVRRSRAENTSGAGDPAPSCYLSESERDARVAALPILDSASSSLAGRLQGAVGARRMIFYDRNTVPRAWQGATITNTRPPHNIEQMGTLNSPENPTNPFMMGQMGYHSDGAREFPWRSTAGLDISPNGSAEKFIIPPASGPIAKAFWRTRASHPNYFGTSANVNGPQLAWEFTTGTTFGEVLKVKDPQTGEEIPFEIRLRTKSDAGIWQMDVLRPFGNPADLAAGLQALCSGGGAPAGCASVSAAIESLRNPRVSAMSRNTYLNASTFGTRRDPMTLNSAALTATQSSALMHFLPELPADVVRALLKTTPFKSVFNEPWIPSDGSTPPGWAPTSRSDFSIVPKNYFAGFIPTTQQACTKCHESAGQHVDNFDPKREQMYAPAPNDAPRPRTWYNFIPGDDRILSWHPFSKRAVQSQAQITRDAVEDCLRRNKLWMAK